MKYIDAEKLIAEINKRLMSVDLEELGNNGSHRVWAYNDVKDIISSLQQEKLLAVIPGFLDRDYHEEIIFSTEKDKFYGDTAFVLPEDSVSFDDLMYETIKVELLIKEA